MYHLNVMLYIFIYENVDDLYTSIDFTYIMYTNKDLHMHENIIIENRMKFQKHKLLSLPQYDISKTESTIMNEAGYTKVWDCGHLIYTR